MNQVNAKDKGKKKRKNDGKCVKLNDCYKIESMRGKCGR
jgi:hypothetical protein